MAWEDDPDGSWVFVGGTADGATFWKRSGPFDDLPPEWWEDDERGPGIPLEVQVPPERDVVTIAPNEYL